MNQLMPPTLSDTAQTRINVQRGVRYFFSLFINDGLRWSSLVCAALASDAFLSNSTAGHANNSYSMSIAEMSPNRSTV